MIRKLKPILRPVSTEIKIEKGIPAPVGHGPTTGVAAIFRKMEVGDSVALPRVLQPNIAYNAGRLGLKMKSRKVSETEIRVWRVA